MTFIFYPIKQLNLVKKLTLFLQILAIQILTCVGAGLQNKNTLICDHEKSASSTAPFVEYYMDHQVTEKEARMHLAYQSRTDHDFDKKPPMPYCDPCTEKIKNYCLGPIFLKDHCCCDFRHEKETLPFIPHSCYSGEIQCSPSTFVDNSCASYEEIRECCCDQVLKKMYNSIYNNSAVNNSHQYLLAAILTFIFLRFR